MGGITYDKNGNILTIQRNGYLTTGSFGLMDDITYDYAGNQYENVNDAATAHGYNDFDDALAYPIEYSYDDNGNQMDDVNKTLQNTYNHLNLPVSIANLAEGSTMHFVYDALGNKLRKTLELSGGGTSNQYYANGFIYDDNGLAFFFTPEGRAVPDASSSEEFRYEYHYTDHLGNTRLRFSDLDEDDEITASSEIIQESHYYPFGMEMMGLNTPQIGPEYKFKYNGAELIDEIGINQYSMAYRNHDPQLARWQAVDPVTHFSQSPYTGLDNNPVLFMDPMGTTADIDHDIQQAYDQKEFMEDMQKGGGEDKKDEEKKDLVVDEYGNQYYTRSDGSRVMVTVWGDVFVIKPRESTSNVGPVAPEWTTSQGTIEIDEKTSEQILSSLTNFSSSNQASILPNNIDQSDLDFAGSVANGFVTIFGASAQYSDLTKIASRLSTTGTLINAAVYVHKFNTGQTKPSDHLDMGVTGTLFILSAVPATSPVGVAGTFGYGGFRLVFGGSFDNWFNGLFETTPAQLPVKK